MASKRANLGYDPSPAQRGVDQKTVERLQGIEKPTDADLVDLGRLLMRYGDHAESMLVRIRSTWGFDEAGLYAACRAIWASGYRPTALSAEVGSGSDVGQE
jgi:hypothetical protein